MSAENSAEEKGEIYSRLLMAERKRILGFIHSLVQDRAAAEDVLQDVSMVLWKKFDSFEIGTDFGAWAMCVARFTVLNWRRKQQKLPLALSEETLQLLADDAVAELSAPEDERRHCLRDCLHKLPEKQRDLIRRYYEFGEEVESIAKRENRTARAIYLRLEKVHSLLLNCLQRTTTINPGGAS